MTFEWLNADLTEVRVTRGWWNRRQAVLKRISYDCWEHMTTERLDVHMSIRIEAERGKHRKRTQARDEWQPVVRLPSARRIR